MAANTSVILLEVLLVGAYDFNMIIVFIFECECLRRGRRPLCSSTSGVTSFVVYSFQGAWFSYFGKAFSDALTSENVSAVLGTPATLSSDPPFPAECERQPAEQQILKEHTSHTGTQRVIGVLRREGEPVADRLGLGV